MASWEKIILSIHLSVFCLLIIAFNTFSIGALNYDLLSRSFVRGKTYFVDPLINNTDVIFWQGRNYWPLGLLPGILLTPFAIGPTIVHAQRYLQFFVLAGIVFLTYKLTRDYHFRKLDSWWLIAAFFFGSILLQSISQPPDWYLAHNIGVFFGLLGIITTIQKKWLLAGISFGLASLARELMILGVIFPILLAWENISHWKSWLTRSIWILIPVITASGITIFYSYIRFGTFNPTYQHTIANLALINPQERNLLFHNGIFNFKYLPANFYYYFLATYDLITEPQNNIIPVAKPPYIKSGYPGISFFVASPVFLYIFGLRKFRSLSLAALITILPMTFILLTLYWPGYKQVGPRYLIDILPFVYLLLLEVFKNQRLPLVAKGLIITSSWINLYLFIHLWI